MQDITNAEITAVLDRHYGSRAKLARRLKVNKGAITQSLNGKGPSQRIQRAAVKMALRLLAEEQRSQNGGSERSAVDQQILAPGRTVS